VRGSTSSASDTPSTNLIRIGIYRKNAPCSRCVDDTEGLANVNLVVCGDSVNAPRMTTVTSVAHVVCRDSVRSLRFTTLLVVLPTSAARSPDAVPHSPGLSLAFRSRIGRIPSGFTLGVVRHGLELGPKPYCGRSLVISAPDRRSRHRCNNIWAGGRAKSNEMAANFAVKP
jgi:hypothetical protein